MTGAQPAARRTGLWVHAITREADAHGDTHDIAGVSGGPVYPVRAAGLAAAVVPVDLAEFGPEPLARNLENLAWLESVARAHHRVVEALGRRGPVIPARLATIYRDDRCVAGMLAERREDLTAALDRVTGRVEWGVKAYASTAERGTAGTGAAGARPDTGAAAGARPGTGYLRRRRAQLSGRDEARRATAEDGEAIHRALAGYAAASRRHPPQPAGLSGRTDWMVVNGTYLVSADLGSRFTDAVAGLARRYPGIELELTGPWPPYSFAVPGDGAAP